MYKAHEPKIEVFGTGWKWINSTQTVQQIAGTEAAGSMPEKHQNVEQKSVFNYNAYCSRSEKHVQGKTLALHAS